MPMLRLHVSTPVDPALQQELISELSSTTAEALSKPESYVMVVLHPGAPMVMAGSAEPAAFFEVRSIGGVAPGQARALSERVTEILGRRLELAPERIYSNYEGVEATMWGHRGSTFG